MQNEKSLFGIVKCPYCGSLFDSEVGKKFADNPTLVRNVMGMPLPAFKLVPEEEYRRLVNYSLLPLKIKKKFMED